MTPTGSTPAVPALADVMSTLVLTSEPMMADRVSQLVWIGSVVTLSVVFGLIGHRLVAKRSLRAGVMMIAVLPAGFTLVAGVIAASLMVLSGHDVAYVLLVVLCSSLATAWVGYRSAVSVGRDIDSISRVLRATADGDRTVRTGLDRDGDVGQLARATDNLVRSLARAETERDAAAAERRMVTEAIGHDLRTPMAALVAAADGLEDNIGDPVCHRRAIRSNVGMLDQLIDDLFLLARLEAGSIEFDQHQVDLGEVVDESAEALQPLFDQGALAAEIHQLGPFAPVVWGDPSALSRLVRNLVANAVRYAPPQSVITIEVGGFPGEVRVSVRDQGPGFPDDFAHIAFERFTRAEPSRDRSSGGAGLGLAIAQSIVEAHNGKIWINPYRSAPHTDHHSSARERPGHVDPARPDHVGAEIVFTIPIAATVPRRIPTPG